MRRPVRSAILVWAMAAVVGAWFLRNPFVGWLVVAPFLVLGPGFVAARFVSPDDRRARWPIAVVAGFSALALVSEIITVAGHFRAPFVVGLLGALTVFAMAFCPEPATRFPMLPRRELALRPGSHAVVRMKPGRRDPLPYTSSPEVEEPVGRSIRPEYTPALVGEPVPVGGGTLDDDREWRELVAMISSPTLATRITRPTGSGRPA